MCKMDEKVGGGRQFKAKDTLYYCSFFDFDDLMELIHFMFLRFSGTEKAKIGQ